jgi:hypothetical protein
MTVTDVIAEWTPPDANSSTDNSSFVPPTQFQIRAVPSELAISRLVYLPNFREGIDPPITCDVLHNELVLEDSWSGQFVAKNSQTLAMIGCKGVIPVTLPTFVRLEAVDFVGLLPLLVTWCIIMGIAAASILVLSRAARRGLVPVYDIKAQFVVLVRCFVGPLYYFLLIDLWLSNGGWVPNALLGVYSAGAAIVIVVGQWWAHPNNISAADALTGPAVQGWAWGFRFTNIILVLSAALGSHMMAAMWSGLLGLRPFSAPAGIWRRIPLLDLALVTVLLMDGPVIAACVYTLVRNEADVAIPLVAWPVACAAGGAVLVEFIMGLAAPLAADEAVVAARVTGLRAMRREIQWLRKREKEQAAAERKASRDKARLAVSGGAVDAEERAAEGLTTVVKKVGVVLPSSGTAIRIEEGGQVRSADGKGIAGRALPAAMEEGQGEGGLDGLDVEDAAGRGLELDAAGGYLGTHKPIPKVAGVRRDAVVFMRSVGAQGVTVPGVPRAGDKALGRGGGFTGRGYALPADHASMMGAESYRSEGVWGGNSAMEVVGRPVTPPEERRRRERRAYKKEQRQRRRAERKEKKRQMRLSQLTARMNDAVSTARSRTSAADATAAKEASHPPSPSKRGLPPSAMRVSAAGGSTTGRSDFTAGGLSVLPGEASRRSLAQGQSLGRAASSGSASGAAPSARSSPSKDAVGPGDPSRSRSTDPSKSKRSLGGSKSKRSLGGSKSKRSLGGSKSKRSVGSVGPVRSAASAAAVAAAASRRSLALGDLVDEVSSDDESSFSDSMASSRSEGTGTSRSEVHAEHAPYQEQAATDVAASLRSKRHAATQASRLRQGVGAAGAANGMLLPVPSMRLHTAGSRFHNGGKLGARGKSGHWADATPIGTGPSFSVAPGAALATAAETRLRDLRANLQ